MIGKCDMLSSLKTGLIFDVDPQAELLLEYLSRAPVENRLQIVSMERLSVYDEYSSVI